MRIAATIAVLIFVATAPAQDRVRAHRGISGQELLRLSDAQLLEMYRHAQPGQIPVGYAPGRWTSNPGKIGNDPLSRLFRATVWQGKHFEPDGTMINRVFGIKMIKGDVMIGPSLLDGKPSNIIDYQRSLVFRPYRDELREVAPGILLGLMFKPKCPTSKIVAYFVIDLRNGCSQCRDAK